MKTAQLIFIMLPIFIAPLAHADVGSASSDGSNQADACDKATKKAAEDAKSHIRFEKMTKPSNSEKEAQIKISDCKCSEVEKPIIASLSATCQVQWSVRWER